MKSKSPVPVAILVRVSTKKQETARQVQELTAYAESKGYRVVEVCRETITGDSDRDQREGLQRVEELAAAGKIQKVLVHEISRLGEAQQHHAPVCRGARWPRCFALLARSGNRNAAAEREAKSGSGHHARPVGRNGAQRIRDVESAHRLGTGRSAAPRARSSAGRKELRCRSRVSSEASGHRQATQRHAIPFGMSLRSPARAPQRSSASVPLLSGERFFWVVSVYAARGTGRGSSCEHPPFFPRWISAFGILPDKKGGCCRF